MCLDVVSCLCVILGGTRLTLQLGHCEAKLGSAQCLSVMCADKSWQVRGQTIVSVWLAGVYLLRHSTSLQAA